MDHKFDGNNWSLIHKTKQVATPNSSVTVTGPIAGSLSGASGQITTTKVTATTDPKLMSTLEKLIDSGREKKQEPLKPWDATTELTVKNDGTPKERPYVLVPLNGIGYLIFHDGTLYQFLFHSILKTGNCSLKIFIS